MSQPTQHKRRFNSRKPYDHIYQTIREKICLLEYPPGMALREEMLAEEFEVSRTPIRSVLKQLEFEELVIHTPGAGVIVTTIDFRLLHEVYKLRLKIAEIVGEMMTSRIPHDHVERLEDILADCQSCRDEFNPTKLARIYYAFDETLRELISNRPLQKIQDQLFHQTARVWLDVLPDLDWEEEVNLVCQEILDVIQAIKSVDLQEIADIRRNSMASLLQRLNNYLGSANQ